MLERLPTSFDFIFLRFGNSADLGKTVKPKSCCMPRSMPVVYPVVPFVVEIFRGTDTIDQPPPPPPSTC